MRIRWFNIHSPIFIRAKVNIKKKKHFGSYRPFRSLIPGPWDLKTVDRMSYLMDSTRIAGNGLSLFIRTVSSSHAKASGIKKNIKITQDRGNVTFDDLWKPDLK